MKKRVILFLVCFFVLHYQTLFAQVGGGLSNSKLNVLSTSIVGKHKLEFAPTFDHYKSSSYWDKESELTEIGLPGQDISSYSSNLYFRFTYGLLKNMEIGVSIPTDVALGNFSVKYRLYNTKKYSFAIAGGLTAPMGDGMRNNIVSTENNTFQLGLGGIFSYHGKNNLSFDADIQYMAFTDDVKSGKGGSFFINGEAGYYICDEDLLIAAGFAYQKHNYELTDFNRFLLTFIPGMVIETGENYTLTIAVPLDVYGKNSPKNVGFSFTLNITLD